MNKKLASRPTLRVGLLALMSVFPLTAWSAVAGQFQFVAGEVRILGVDGRTRPAQKGQDISEGETVVTGANASAQLKMIDGGILALRPDTQLKMDAYVFKGREDGSEKANISLVKGGLRAISGLIGKTNKQNYAITTPTATIGIRGTDHEPVVVLPPPPGQQSANPPGTYNKVNVGATILRTLTGSAIINPNQVGFAGAPNQNPMILPRVPDFYRVTPLPSQRQQQAGQSGQSGDTAGNQSTASNSNSSQSTNSSNADAGSTTTSASGSTGGDAMRVSGQADLSNSQALNQTGANGFSNSGSGLPGTYVQTRQTGADDKGNTLDTGTQLLTTTSERQLSTTYTDMVGSGFIGEVPLSYLRYLLSDAGNVADSAGNVTQANYALRGHGPDLYRYSVAVEGATPTDFGNDKATGLSWGRWIGGSVKTSAQEFRVIQGPNNTSTWGYGAEKDGLFKFGASDELSTAMSDGGLHWISAVKSYPDYLPSVLTGTVDYRMIGGTAPTNADGLVGKLLSASLSVNFSDKLASSQIGLQMGSDNWDISSVGMVLNQGSFSSLYSSCTITSVTCLRFRKNGSEASANGIVSGSLSGPALNGAALSYQFSESAPSLTTTEYVAPIVMSPISGVVALGQSGGSIDMNTKWRPVGISTGWTGINNFGDLLTDEYTPLLYTAAAYRGYVDGNDAAVDRVKLDSANRLTEFVGRAELPDIVSSNEAIVRIGSGANNVDNGSATLGGTTVYWGRWENGSIDVYDKNGTRLGSLDNTGRSLHWLTTGTLTGPLATLPLTGTASYTLVGGTRPTDMNGNAGTLGSASLSANFSEMKVSAEVVVNMAVAGATTTLSTKATDIALQPNAGFSSRTGAYNPYHTASCTGSCGANTQAYISGSFIGAGAAGAALTYGIANGSASTSPTTTALVPPTNLPGVAVTGTAVFKKNP